MLFLTKISTCIGILLILGSWQAMAQDHYEHPIEGVTKDWHRLELPTEMFRKIDRNFASIRVYGQNDQGALMEQPYLLRREAPTAVNINIPFKIINRSNRGRDHYYTFQLSDNQSINQINLNFTDRNFDWKVQLEGSNDQKEWFTLLDDYRILSIENETTNYRFTQLVFPAAKYVYYRLKVPTKTTPALNSATLSRTELTAGKYLEWTPTNIVHLPKPKTKTSVLRIDLPTIVPVSYLQIQPEATYDYYRSFEVRALIDSVKVGKEWRENWRLMGQGTLSSFEKNEFTYPEQLTSAIEVTIQNYDNQLLDIPTVIVKGAAHELLVRFEGQPPFRLHYGNAKLATPRYDLVNFKKNIPEDLSLVTLGKSRFVKGPAVAADEPLFKNPWWLWVLMGLVIVVIGGFTVSMMRKV